MESTVPATPAALREALLLAEQILSDIELSRASLNVCALKTSHLARLLNDFDAQMMFSYEAGGYPTTRTGIPEAFSSIAKLAGRVYETEETGTGNVTSHAYVESAETLEQLIETAKIQLQVARDPDVSISSSNPSQYIHAPLSNKLERKNLTTALTKRITRLELTRFCGHLTPGHTDPFGGSPHAERLFDYNEMFYNPKRRHSSLGGCSPIELESLTELA